MTDHRHITWENLSALIETGIPQRMPIAGAPTLWLWLEGSQGGLRLLVPFDEGHAQIASGLTEVQIGKVTLDGAAFLTVGTSEAKLFQQCHALLTAIADDIQLRGRSVAQAIADSIAAWRLLLQQVSGMSADEQVGLVGELWLVHRAFERYGLDSIDCWLGPRAEVHDFSAPTCLIEVKTTLNRERIHIVSDLRQFVPTPGRPLYILSIQLQPVGAAGNGTLPAAVRSIESLIASDSQRADLFAAYLRKVKYSHSHESHYSASYRLRTKPALVLVNDDCPKVSPELLRKAIGAPLADRISRVTYSVNLDGLGWEDGTSEFVGVLPAASGGDLL